MIPPAEPSVHDNHVYAYAVDCASRRLVLYTAFTHRDPAEYTDVIFRDVFAHHFEHAMDVNILFDVAEVDVADLVRADGEVLAQSWRYDWPPFEYDGDLDRLVGAIRAAPARAYAITSSYGMSGWVIAGRAERVARDAPAVVTQ